MASEGLLLEGVLDLKVIRWGVASWMFTLPRISTTSPWRRVDDEVVEGDDVLVRATFGKWTVEMWSVSEPQADREEAADDASDFLLRAISSSRTFRDSQEGEGGMEEYRRSLEDETVVDTVKVVGSTKSKTSRGNGGSGRSVRGRGSGGVGCDTCISAESESGRLGSSRSVVKSRVGADLNRLRLFDCSL